MAEGWIKLHRKIKAHWLWDDATRLQWWIGLLLDANHDAKKVLIKGKLIDCQRGQSIKSLNTLSKEWRVSKKGVRHFLDLLENDKIISTENLRVTTRITICKYEDYQETGNAKETQGKRKRNAEETQGLPKQECKELEEQYTFNSFWEDYGKKIGRTDCEKIWRKLSNDEKQLIQAKVKPYVLSTPDAQYRKHPKTWLNAKGWEDEIKTASAPNTGAVLAGYNLFDTTSQ